MHMANFQDRLCFKCQVTLWKEEEHSTRKLDLTLNNRTYKDDQGGTNYTALENRAWERTAEWRMELAFGGQGDGTFLRESDLGNRV